MYNLALVSYVLALGHFALEFVVYRTAGLGPGLISPLIVACEWCRDVSIIRWTSLTFSQTATSLIWMTQREFSFGISAPKGELIISLPQSTASMSRSEQCSSSTSRIRPLGYKRGISRVASLGADPLLRTRLCPSSRVALAATARSPSLPLISRQSKQPVTVFWDQGRRSRSSG